MSIQKTDPLNEERRVIGKGLCKFEYTKSRANIGTVFTRHAIRIIKQF